MGVSFAQAEALMLAEHGPSRRLEELLNYITENIAPIRFDKAMSLVEWVRARAARSG